jgi:hypothetical protein
MSDQEPDWDKSRRWWYSQTYILLEIVKLLQHRELVFLEKPNPTIIDRKPKTIRCACGYTLDLLKSNFNSFRVLDYPHINLYYSLMSLDKMPLFSFSPSVRALKYTEWSNGLYKQHWTGYTFALDFDGDTIEEARQDLLKVKKLYDQYKIPYSITFSGSRGFHLVVDYRWLPQLPEGKIVPFLGELATMMKEIDNIPSLDDSIFDSRRVLKVPYSFDRGNIVLPLDDYQIENFNLQMVNPEQVIKSIQIKGRGLLERHTNQSEEQARESFLKLAKNFIEVSNYVGSWIHSKTKE